MDGAEWRASWRNGYLAGDLAIGGVTRWEYGTLSGLNLKMDEVRARPVRGTRKARAHLPKQMALTFDDGPNGNTTQEVLSTLAASGARATFFLLADCIGHEQALVKQEVAAGHEIGNHSWGHVLMTRLGVEAALANVQRAEGIISAASGKRCRWMRPPYGATTAAQRKALLDAGYSIALWSVDTEDWKKPGADVIYRRIMAGAEPGAIVLCHDGGGDRAQTLAALARAVPDLTAQGYQLVTLSELEESAPSDDTGVVLVSGKGEWLAHAPREPVRVSVRGKELEGLAPILAAHGRVLLPAGKVLDALGAQWEWDREAQAIAIDSGRVRLRLDSPRVTWGDRELRLDVPPILYHGVPLVSAEVLARAAGVPLRVELNPLTYDFAPAEGRTEGAQ
jgi:peptidoglycan/xylan/chitin deacetylase (PgdA/CDA1 family)